MLGTVDLFGIEAKNRGTIGDYIPPLIIPVCVGRGEPSRREE